MFFIPEIDRMKREARVIRESPISFIIACLIAGGVIWGGFHFYYKDKLDNAHEDANNWKSRAGYWKEKAEEKPKTPEPIACPKVDCPKLPPRATKATATPPLIKQSLIENEGGQIGEISNSGTTTMTAAGTTNQSQSGAHFGPGSNVTSFSAKDIDICYGNDWGCFVKNARNAAQQHDSAAFEERVKEINRKTELHLLGHAEQATQCHQEVAAGIAMLRSHLDDETATVEHLLSVSNMPICFMPR